MSNISLLETIFVGSEYFYPTIELNKDDQQGIMSHMQLMCELEDENTFYLAWAKVLDIIFIYMYM